jgi:hypothetical protein
MLLLLYNLKLPPALLTLTFYVPRESMSSCSTVVSYPLNDCQRTARLLSLLLVLFQLICYVLDCLRSASHVPLQAFILL